MRFFPHKKVVSTTFERGAHHFLTRCSPRYNGMRTTFLGFP